MDPQIYWSSNVFKVCGWTVETVDFLFQVQIWLTSGWTVIEGQILLAASGDPLDPQIYWSSNVLVALTLQSRWLDSRNS